MLLLSQDYGKHLLGVEDLLQKHALVEADIAIQADRVKNVNATAQKFAIDGDSKKYFFTFYTNLRLASFHCTIYFKMRVERLMHCQKTCVHIAMRQSTHS